VTLPTPFLLFLVAATVVHLGLVDVAKRWLVRARAPDRS
jgi:hypothetical protein